jgi:hypothetical protein
MNAQTILKELDELLKEGSKLLADGQNPEMVLGEFAPRYETWYSKALSAITQIAPSRLAEFKEAYRHEKRREITYDTYAISDFLLGLRVRFRGELTFNPVQAFGVKLLRQVGIVSAATHLAPSALRDIKAVLRAGLFDSDLDAARALLKAQHLRSAGVVCGVVLEAHLKGCCFVHQVKITKKSPGISDLNDLLKDAGIYDVPMWRLLQRLADIRNLCGHKKERDPKPDEVEDLISGTDKVIKEVA